MRWRLVLLALILATADPAMRKPSAAQLFGAQMLDPAYCNVSTVRQTVVYVDDMMMEQGRTDWAAKLATKLKATLAPGERTTVVQLTPANGQSSEVWSGCWPDVTDMERAEMAGETNIFSRNRLTVLKEQQAFFVRDLGIALTKIYQATERSAQATRISALSPPTKQLVRALASDEGRFSQGREDITIRAVVYSNLAENSDLGSVLLPAPDPVINYGKKLGTYLRHSVFYIFGVGDGVYDAKGFPEAARQFWQGTLRSMAATVGGIGSDLNIPNNVPVRAYNFEVELDQEGRLDGRLSLLTDRDGNLVDSWIGIARLTSVGLQGSLRCQDSVLGPCKLDATTTAGIVTHSAAEVLTLAGSPQHGMTGKLGVHNTSMMFDIKALPRER
jgi:hypothetical protein